MKTSVCRGSMYSFVAARRKYGACLPRRLDSGHRTSRLVAKAMCSNFTEVIRIDALKELPKSYPAGCRELRDVKEIVLVDNLACVLMKSGLARCYDSTDGILLCELNPVDPSAVHFAAVHTLVHNASNNTLIIAYSSLPAHLQCKVVLIEALREGRVESPTYSFQFECVVLRHPAFFEFCGTNKRIGAADLYKHVYRFWNMSNYQPVFEIQGQGYQEIRVSDGVVVMLSQPRYNIIPISLYDIEDGSLLATRELEIVEHRELQFLELLVTQLLIKQQGGLMRAYDILRGDGFAVDNTMHFRPNGFVFYDTSTGLESDDVIAASKKKFSYRPRKFFTISKMSIEFWELTRCYLIRTRQLYIEGTYNSRFASASITEAHLVRYDPIAAISSNGCIARILHHSYGCSKEITLSSVSHKNALGSMGHH